MLSLSSTYTRTMASRSGSYSEASTRGVYEGDQLDEARDVALLCSAKYQQALHWYHDRRVWGRAFNIGDLLLCFVQSNKNYHKFSLLWEGPHVIAGVL